MSTNDDGRPSDAPPPSWGRVSDGTEDDKLVASWRTSRTPAAPPQPPPAPSGTAPTRPNPLPTPPAAPPPPPREAAHAPQAPARPRDAGPTAQAPTAQAPTAPPPQAPAPPWDAAPAASPPQAPARPREAAPTAPTRQTAPGSQAPAAPVQAPPTPPAPPATAPEAAPPRSVMDAAARPPSQAPAETPPGRDDASVTRVDPPASGPAGTGPRWVVRTDEQAAPARFTAPQPTTGDVPWLAAKPQAAPPSPPPASAAPAREQARVREAPPPVPPPPPAAPPPEGPPVASAPAAFDRPQSMPTPPGPPGQRVFRPGLRSGIAVAAVATLIAGGVAYMLKGDGVPGVSSGPGADGAADASGVFAVQAALYDGHEQAITSVAVAGETAVTVGSETVDRQRGQILVSTDGADEWRVAEVKREGAASPFDVPSAVATSGKAWAALGAGPAGVAVWTSADGGTWTHRASVQGFQQGDTVTSLAATQSGFAAAGSGGDGKPALWTSADGTAWQRAAASLKEAPKSMAAAGGALVVLTGKGELWRSADNGGTWTRAEVPEADGSFGPVVALANGPGGFHAAREGSEGGRDRAVFYRSPDGQSWSYASSNDRRHYKELTALNGTSEGLTALVPLTDGRLAVERSDDGVKWQPVERLDTGDGKAATAAAALPKGVVVAGTQDNGAYLAAPGAQHGDVNLLSVPGAVTPDRTLTRLLSGGGTTLAIGSGAGDAAVWHTRDGASWTRAGGDGLGGPGVQRLADAAHGPQGWVAAGGGLLVTSADGGAWTRATTPKADKADVSGVAYGKSGYVAVGTVVWHSADLTSWTEGTGDLGDGRMRDVVATNAGYVAVGESAADVPAVWASPDGKSWTPVQLPQAAGTLTKVVARGDTLVATGDRNLVGVSADAGKTWALSTLDAAAITASAATDGGFVLAGTPAGTSDVALWTSADGRSWQVRRPEGSGLNGDGSQRITGLTALGDELLATGTNGTTPTLWRTDPP
ncbi:hypothetical protein ACFHW2_08670 [Actinomadura sp. LOL_016]|uniref:hypothetical protein n=1 Tax=Actinomadura sp. LOL_016 TaxID=3345411 RepID=UPI003A87E025